MRQMGRTGNREEPTSDEESYNGSTQTDIIALNRLESKSLGGKVKTTKLLSVSEFARELGLDVRVARRAVRFGQIPSVRIGCRNWIPKTAIERVLSCELTNKSTM